MLPADLDGSILPPAGAPNPFIMSGTATTQRIYRMHVDFGTPANTTFTLAATLDPPAFTLACTTTRACVPEPNGDRLDAIGDRPMFRAAYRRFADGHEALVGNETVCVANGGNCNRRHRRRLRALVGDQEPDVGHAVDRPVSARTSPTRPIAGWVARRWTCRATWPSATAPQARASCPACAIPGGSRPIRPTPWRRAKSTMFAGAGSQSGTSNRWGDYSDLTIDPVDDCTFWYTSEYYPTGSTQFNWRTRVVSFKFPGCVAGPHGTAHFSVTQCGTSNPVANAAVTIDGNNYGLTNASGVLDATLTPGSHAWVVSETGWSSANSSVSITDGVTTNVSPCLSSGTAHFVVTNCSTSAPLQGATVTVDGTVMGQTNASGVLDVPLVPGAHNWVVTRNNYSQAQNSVNITNNTTTTVPTCLSPTCFETTSFSEWFDGVTAPALPAGWSTQVVQGPAPAWVTSNTAGALAPAADSAPNSAFVDDPSVVSDKVLVSPAIAIASQAAQLAFRQRGVFEAGWDGGVLEIKIGGGSFTDIITAGGSFGVGGYTTTLLSGNPMAGRMAWSGTVGSASSFDTVTVTLPSAAAGQSVQFRWREGSDVSVAGSGWRIDGVTLNDCLPNPPTTPPPTVPPTPTQAPTPSPTPTQAPTPTPTQVPTPTPTQPTAPPPTPTPTSSGPTARLTSSTTTCAQWTTATPLTGVAYTTRASKIASTNPTTFRYWVKVNATAGANTVTVTQTIATPNTFNTLFKLNTGGNVYNTGCASSFSPTFTSSGTSGKTGTVTVNFTAPTAGTYYVTVNYTGSSLKNKAVPSPTPASFSFAVANVSGSSTSLSLHQ